MNSKDINRNVWALTLSLCLGVVFTHATGYAAEERGMVGGIVSPAQFGTRLQDHDRQLTSIEGLFARIEAAKTTADKDKRADELNNTLAAYAKAMMESFDTAIKQAELAAKTQGKKGSTALLKSFEALAVKHENRMKQLDGRAQKIKPPSESSSTSEPVEGGKVARGSLMLEKISDFFIGPAQAAIALAVYAACHNADGSALAAAQWANCIQVTNNAITLKAQAQSTFNTCWNNLESVRPKWWRAVRRAGCVTALTVRLA